MEKILIFGGTTEGRMEARRIKDTGADVTVCVTSEYARALLPKDIDCHVGVMDENAMRDFILHQRPDRIIDATHPFALRATRTIRACARERGILCTRIERPREDAAWRDAVEHVADAAAAALALQRTQGNVLLTTGSHTISVYTAQNDTARLYVRVLPTAQALELCAHAGVWPAHIIAMQGPFSAALNAAMYDQLKIRALVTKDSGEAGGVEEKVLPALERDIHVIVIDRPREEEHAR